MRDLTRPRWVLALGFFVAACGGKTDDANSGSGGAGGSGGVIGTGGSGVGGSAGGAAGACVVESSGKLPAPAAPDATLTGPGIVATDSGFAIGYRDQAGDTLRAIMLAVSDSGAASAPQVFDLGGCASVVVKDGVSLAYANGQGMLAASLPDCGTGAGAVFVPFFDGGKVEQASGPKNGAFKQLLTSVHALAPAKTPGEYELVYAVTSDIPSVVERVVLQGPVFKTVVPIARPFGDAPLPWAMVATSDQSRAFLAPDPAQGTLNLRIGPQSGDQLNLAPAVSLAAGDSGDVVAVGPRVVAGVRSTDSMNISVWSLVTGGTTKIAEGTLPVPEAASGSSALAADGDQLFAVHGGGSNLTLQRVSGITSTPNFGAMTTSGFSVLTHPFIDTDGTHVAIAAARGKVAIVWLANDGGDAGGWLIARCE